MPGIDLKIKNLNGETALILAVKSRDSKSLELILRAGGSSLTMDENGFLPIEIAMKNPESLNSDSKLPNTSPASKTNLISPFYEKAEIQNIIMQKQLIKSMVNQINNLGENGVFYSIRLFKHKILRLLLKTVVEEHYHFNFTSKQARNSSENATSAKCQK